MTRIDLYIFKRLFGPLVFFVFVLTGIVWLTQALSVVDLVINSNATANTLFIFTSFLIPEVLTLVMPIASVIAVVYTLNLLFSEKEAIVMIATGMRPIALLKGFFAFGLVAALLLAMITFFFAPEAKRRFNDMQETLKNQVAEALFRPGNFVKPSDNIIVFISNRDADGRLEDVFIQNDTDPKISETYSAEYADILRGDHDEPIMILRSGVLQRLHRTSNEIDVVTFSRFSLDISAYMPKEVTRKTDIDELGLLTLLRADQTDADQIGESLGKIKSKAHSRIALPLLTIAYILIAASYFFAARYNRQRMLAPIFFSIFSVMVLELSTSIFRSYVEDHAEAWGVIYIPILIGLSCVAYNLFRATHALKPIKMRILQP